MMKRRHWREPIKSFFGSHIDPENDEHLKGSKLEVEDKMSQIMELINDEEQEEGNESSTKKSKREQLSRLIEDFHKHYDSLHDRYDHLTGELWRKVGSKREKKGTDSSSDSGSDSEYDYSLKEKGNNNEVFGSGVAESMRQELETARAEVADLKEKLSATIGEREALHDELEKAVNQMKKVEDVIGGLRTDNERLSFEKSTLIAENEDLNIKLNGAGRLEAELNQMIGELKSEKNTLITESAVVLDRIEEGRKIIEDLRVIAAQNEAENITLKQEVESVTGEALYMKQQLESAQQEVAELSENLRSAEEDNRSLASKLSESSKEIEQLQNQIKVLISEAQDLKDKQGERERELLTLSEMHEVHKTESSARKAGLETQITTLEVERDSLSGKLKEMRERIDKEAGNAKLLEEENQGQQFQISKLEIMSSEKSNKISSLLKKLEENENKQGEREMELLNLREMHEVHRTESSARIASLEAQITTLEVEHDSLNSKLKEMQEQIDREAGNAKVLGEENQGLISKLEIMSFEKSDKISFLLKKIEENENKLGERERELEVHKTESSARIAGLEAQITTSEVERDSLSGKLKEMQEQIDWEAGNAKVLEEENKGLQFQISKLEIMSSEKGDEISSLLKKLEENENKLGERERELPALREMHEVHKAESSARIAGLEALITTLEVECDSLSGKLKEMQEQIDREAGNANVLEEENQGLKFRISKLEIVSTEKSDEISCLLKKLEENENKLGERERELPALRDMHEVHKAESSARIAGLEALITTLEVERDSLSGKLKEMQEQIDREAGNANVLEEENQRLQFQISKFEIVSTEKSDEISCLLKKLEENENYSGERERELLTLREMHVVHKTESSARIAGLEAQITTLEVERDSLSGKLKEMQEQIDREAGNAKVLEEVNQGLQFQISKLEIMSSERSDEISCLLKKLEENENKLGERERELPALREMHEVRKAESSARIAGLEALIATLEVGRDSLSGKLKEMQEQIDREAGNAKVLEEENQGLKFRISKLEIVSTEKSDEISCLLKKLEENENKLGERERELPALRDMHELHKAESSARIAGLEELITTLEVEQDSLSGKLKEMQEQIDREAGNARQKKKTKGCNSNQSEICPGEKTESSARIASLEAQITTLEVEHDSLNSKLKEMQEQIDREAGNAKVLEEENQGLQFQISKLEIVSSEKSDEISCLLKKLEENENNSGERERELLTLREMHEVHKTESSARIAGLEAQITTLEVERDSLSGKLKEMQEQIDREAGNAKVLEEENQGLQFQISKLEIMSSEKSDEISCLLKKLEENENKLGERERELPALREMHEVHKAESSARMAGLEALITTLEVERDSLSCKLKEMQEQIDREAGNAKVLEEENQGLKFRISKLEIVSTEKSDEISCLLKKLEENENKLGERERELPALRDMHEVHKAESSARIAGLEALITTLEVEQDSLSGKLKEMQEQIDREAGNANVLEEENQRLQFQISKLEIVSTEKSDEISCLLKKLEENENYSGERERELLTLREMHVVHKTESSARIAGLEAQITTLEVERDSLSGKLKEMQEQIDREAGNAKVLEEENQGLQFQISKLEIMSSEKSDEISCLLKKLEENENKLGERERELPALREMHEVHKAESSARIAGLEALIATLEVERDSLSGKLNEMQEQIDREAGNAKVLEEENQGLQFQISRLEIVSSEKSDEISCLLKKLEENENNSGERERELLTLREMHEVHKTESSARIAGLEAQITTLEVERDSLSGKLKEMQEQIDREAGNAKVLEEENQGLQFQISKLEIMSSEKSDEISCLLKKLEENENKLGERERELPALREMHEVHKAESSARIAGLEALIATLEVERDSLSGKLKEMQEQIDREAGNAKVLEEENQGLQFQISRLEIVSSEKSDEISCLLKKLEENENNSGERERELLTLREMHEVHKTESSARIAGLEAQITTLEVERDSLSGKLKEMQEQIDREAGNAKVLEEENQGLQFQISKLEIMSSEKSDEISCLLKKLEENENKLGERERELPALREMHEVHKAESSARMAGLEALITTLEVERDSLSCKLKEMQEQIDREAGNAKVLEEENQGLKFRISKLEIMSTEKSDEISCLLKKLEENENKLGERERELPALRDMHEVHKAESSARIAGLEALITTLEVERDSLSGKLKEMQEQMDREAGNANVLEEENQRLQFQISKLEIVSTEKSDEISCLLKKLEENENYSGERERELLTLREMHVVHKTESSARIAGLEAQIITLEVERDSLSGKLKEMQEQIDREAGNAKVLEEENQGLQFQISKLEIMSSEKSDEISCLMKKLEENENKLGERERELPDLREMHEVHKAESSARIAGLEALIATLEVERDSLSGKLNEMQEQIDREAGNAKVLGEENQGLQFQISRLEIVSSEKSDEISCLLKKLEENENNLGERERELLTLREMHEVHKTESSARIAGLEAQITTLEVERDSLSGKLKEMQEQIDREAGNAKVLEEENQGLQFQISKLEIMSSEKSDEISCLLKKLEENENKLGERERELPALREMHEVHKAESSARMAGLEALITTLEVERDSLSSKLKEMQEQIDREAGNAKVLEEENQGLKFRISKLEIVSTEKSDEISCLLKKLEENENKLGERERELPALRDMHEVHKAESSARIAGLEALITTLEVERDSLSGKLKEMQEQIDREAGNANVLEEENQGLQFQISKLEIVSTEKSDEISCLLKKLEENENYSGERERELLTLREMHVVHKTESSARIAGLEAQITTLEVDRDSLSGKLKEMQEQIDREAGNAKVLEEENQGLQFQISKLEIMSSEKSDEISCLMKNLEENENKLGERERELPALREMHEVRKAESSARIASLEALIATLEVEQDSLIGKLNEMQEQIDREAGNAKVLEEENQGLQFQISKLEIVSTEKSDEISCLLKKLEENENSLGERERELLTLREMHEVHKTESSARIAGLEAQITPLEVERDSLSGKLKEMQEQIDREAGNAKVLEEENQGLQFQISRLEIMSSEKSDEISCLLKKLEENENKLGERERELPALREMHEVHMAESSARMAGLEALITTLEVKRDSLCGKLKEMQVQIDREAGNAKVLEEENQGLKFQISKLEIVSSEKSDEISSLLKKLEENENKLGERERELLTLREMLEVHKTESSARIAGLEAQITTLEVERDSLCGKLKEMQEQIDREAGNAKVLEEVNQGLQFQISKLEIMSSEKSNKISCLLKKLEENENKLGERERELPALREMHEVHKAESSARMAGLEALITALEVERDSLSSKLKEMQEQIDREAGNAKVLEEENQGLQFQISKLEIVSTEKGDEISCLLKKLEENENKLGERERELPALRDMHEVHKAESSARIAGLEALITTLEVERDSLSGKLTEMQEQIDREAGNAKVLEEENQGLQFQISKLEIVSSVKSDEMSSLLKKFVENENILGERERELLTLMEMHEVHKTESSARIAGLEAQVKTLVVEHDSLSGKLKEMQEQIDREAGNAKVLEEENQGLQFQISKLEIVSSEKSDEISCLLKKLEENENKLGEKERELPAFWEMHEVHKSELSAQIAGLVAHITSLEVDYDSQSSKLKEMEEQIEKKEAEAKQLEEENQGLQSQISKLEFMSNEKSNEISFLMKKLEDNEHCLLSEIEYMTGQVKNLNLDVDSLRAQKGELEQLIGQKTSELSDLVRSFEDQVSAMQQELGTANSQRIELELQLQQKAQEILGFELQIENLKGELASKIAVEEKILGEQRGFVGRIKEMELEVEFLLTEKSHLEGKVISSNSIIDELTKEKNGLGARAIDLERELTEREDELSTLQKTFENGEREASFQISSLTEQVSSLQQEVDLLRAQKADLEEQMARVSIETSAQIQGLLDQGSVLQQELESLKNHKARSELHIEKINDEMSGYLTHIQNLKEELASKTVDHQRLLEENAALMVQVMNLESEVDSLRRQKTELDELLTSRNSDIDQLHDRILELEQNVKDSEDELSTLQTKVADRDTEASGQIMSLTAELDSLKGELHSLQAQKSQLELELEKEKQESSESLTQVQAWLQDSKLNLQDVERKMEEMAEGFHKGIELKDEMIADLERMLDDLKRDLEIKEDELGSSVENVRSIEVQLRLSNQKLRVTEQLLTEKEENHKIAEERYQKEQRALEERVSTLSRVIAVNNEARDRIIADITDKVKGTLAGLESLTGEFERGCDNLMRRVTDILYDFKNAKDWVVETRIEKQELKGEVAKLTEQLQEKEKQVLVLKEKVIDLELKVRKEEREKESLSKAVAQLQNIVGELEKVMKEKDEGMLGLGEEKREAIRQLCLWIDYHRSCCEDLKELLLKMTRRSQRAARRS
ncbi:Protein Networked (NET), actin-binding (NAB) domain [Dillenia turbinata]|uniref:Protein Networked (NET), actin-binding (NAB) domain n=1 Tax=Dillenia turbinata TaxID=194707 RepID=A0AAN8VTF5_9MAGN